VIRLRRGLAAFGALWCLLACSSAREAEARKSAARVARAIEVLRNSPNQAKAGPLAELGKLGCGAGEICAARDTCLVAYRLHVDAVALTEAAKLQVASRDDQMAGKLLISADQKLNEAGVRVADCVEREAALRHRYKL
jgi:hypothetical protein